jgi:formate dehydrogenase subunit delta
MSSTQQSVIRMANQIARNFAVHGDAQAIEETAEHIRLFWDPRMKEQAIELLTEADCGFSAQARAALSRIAAEADHHAA